VIASPSRRRQPCGARRPLGHDPLHDALGREHVQDRGLEAGKRLRAFAGDQTAVGAQAMLERIPRRARFPCLADRPA
jgi:hypothetical protein